MRHDNCPNEDAAGYEAKGHYHKNAGHPGARYEGRRGDAFKLRARSACIRQPKSDTHILSSRSP